MLEVNIDVGLEINLSFVLGNNDWTMNIELEIEVQIWLSSLLMINNPNVGIDIEIPEREVEGLAQFCGRTISSWGLQSDRAAQQWSTQGQGFKCEVIRRIIIQHESMIAACQDSLYFLRNS